MGYRAEIERGAIETMIRWGILGCGDVTEVKSGPALQNASRSSVVACMRRDSAKAHDYATRHKIPRAYSEADELINDPDVDAVYIATPPDSHAELAIRALKTGKPVFVEKPMALTVAECDAMIATSKDNSAALVIAYYRRALPRFEALRGIVLGGEIGEPRCVSVQHFKCADDRPGQSWKLDPSVGGGGYFADMQTHTLDWLGYVFGPATSVAGNVRRQSERYAAEDFVSYTIGFKDIVANGLCAYSAGQTAESVTIHGSKGSATMSFFAPSPIILKLNGVRTVREFRDPPHVHQPLVTRMIKHLLDKAENPSSGESARRTTAIMEQLYG